MPISTDIAFHSIFKFLSEAIEGVGKVVLLFGSAAHILAPGV